MARAYYNVVASEYEAYKKETSGHWEPYGTRVYVNGNLIGDNVDGYTWVTDQKQNTSDPIWGTMYIISNIDPQADFLKNGPGLTDGHAWIRLERKDGAVGTVSLWGNRGDQELWNNLEVKRGYGAIFKSATITEAQYQKLKDYMSNPSNCDWTIFNTCAGFSAGAWNYVTGDNLSAMDMGMVTTPRALSYSIGISNGTVQPHVILTPTPGSAMH